VTESLAGDQWEIRQLVERYANAADHADGEAAAALFTDDGELEVWLDPAAEAPSSRRRGRPEIAAAISWVSRYRATQHVISNSVADINGDVASGSTHCTAHHVEPEGSGGHDRVLFIRYVDAFVRTHEGWRFARRDLRVQWISKQPVESI
jgi:uncharacterized protein (TIGR02246 family)